MLYLAKTASKENLRGYIWQLSQEGFHYEVEVLDSDGDIQYNKQHRISFEEAEVLLQDMMTVLAHEEQQRLFSTFG